MGKIGDAACVAVLAVTTADTTTATVVASSGQQYNLVAGRAEKLPVTLTVGTEMSYSLNYGGPAAAGPVKVVAGCGSGAPKDGKCQPEALAPYMVVYAALPWAPPYRFAGTSCADLTVSQAANETRWKGTFEPFAYGMLYRVALPSGRVLFSARPFAQPNAFDLTYVSVINPITNVVTDYDGSEGPPPDTTNDGVTQPEAGWMSTTRTPALDEKYGKYAVMSGFTITVP